MSYSAFLLVFFLFDLSLFLPCVFFFVALFVPFFLSYLLFSSSSLFFPFLLFPVAFFVSPPIDVLVFSFPSNFSLPLAFRIFFFFFLLFSFLPLDPPPPPPPRLFLCCKHVFSFGNLSTCHLSVARGSDRDRLHLTASFLRVPLHGVKLVLWRWVFCL